VLDVAVLAKTGARTRRLALHALHLLCTMPKSSVTCNDRLEMARMGEVLMMDAGCSSDEELVLVPFSAARREQMPDHRDRPLLSSACRFFFPTCPRMS